MKVLLLGATGFSGKQVLQNIFPTEHEITVLVRDPSKLGDSDHSLRIVAGDVMNPVVLAKALQGQDAVLNCLGIGGKGNGKLNTFLSDSTTLLTQTMEKEGVKRLIAMSNVGAGDSAAFHPWMFKKFILPYFMKWLHVIIEEKNKMEGIITQSSLQWTIVRCPDIRDTKSTGSVLATTTGAGLKMSIPKGDMADFLIGQLSDTTFLYKTPSISAE